MGDSQKYCSAGLSVRHLLPCVVLLAVFLFEAFSAVSCYAANADQEYAAAKTRMEQLQEDSKRRTWRDPWIKLAQEFHALYKANTRWSKQPAALFRSAECLEKMADQSRVKADYQSAVQRYMAVAEEFPRSVLADDALYKVAEIRISRLANSDGGLAALARLRKTYPQGDMFGRAVALEKITREGQKTSPPESATPPPPPPPQVQKPQVQAPVEKPVSLPPPAVLRKVSWKNLSDGRVQLIIMLDKKAGLQARMFEVDARRKISRLVLDLEDSVPQAKVEPFTSVQNSPLTRIEIEKPGERRVRISFHLKNLVRFEQKVEAEPFRIILTLNNDPKGKGTLQSRAVEPRAQEGGGRREVAPLPSSGRSEQRRDVRTYEDDLRDDGISERRSAAMPKNFALRTIVLDAGHGGQDPGAMRNGVVERSITLDIVMRLGRILQKNGVKVVYTRRANTTVSLPSRVTRAHRSGAQLFVSIHVNANRSSYVEGFETYVPGTTRGIRSAAVAARENAAAARRGAVASMSTAGDRRYSSYRLGTEIHRSALAKTRQRGFTVNNNGTRTGSFHVLRTTQIPAVLVEVGYCTNKREARNILNPKYRAAVAEGVAEGILRYANVAKITTTKQHRLAPKAKARAKAKAVPKKRRLTPKK